MAKDLLRTRDQINADLKLISKALAPRLKDMLPDLISSNHTAYVKNRYISESGRLTYDVLETASILKENRIPNNSRY